MRTASRNLACMVLLLFGERGIGQALPIDIQGHAGSLSSNIPQSQVTNLVSDLAGKADSSAVVPSGAIMFLKAGTCPSGWTEEASLAGNYILATTAAAGDVGTSGGSSSYTPAGTSSAPVFTGSAGTVPAQTFTGASNTTSAVSGGTPAGTVSTPTFTGNAVVAASTNSGTKLVTGNTSTGVSPVTTATGTVSTPAFTGSALGTHTHTVTPTGTNSTVSFTPAGTVAAPSFTGTPATITPVFYRMIPCSKN